jgi:PAS domain S-box-containing protein
MDQEKEYSILYVDDDEINLRVFLGLFRRKYNVVTSNSAKEALRLFDEQSFDLVISDQQMPKMTGLQLLANIKEKNPLIPTILLTGFSDYDVLKKALNEIGVHKCINKPFDPSSLAIIIDLAIEGYQLNKEKELIQNNLTRSESKFRGIFNSMSDVLTRSNFEGKIEIISPSVEAIYGYKPEDLIGKDISILCGSRDKKTAHITKLKEVKYITELETVIVTKDGKKKNISLTSKLYYDDKNNPGGIESIVRDVSEKKKLEELLKEQNNLLEETQKMAGVGSLNYETNSNEIKWSDTLANIYGIDKSDVIGNQFQNYLNFFHHSDRLRAKKIIFDAIKLNQNFSFEARIIRPDGKEKVLFLLGKVMTNNETQLQNLTVACLDITESKIKENELIKSEAKFRLLAEELPLAVLKVNKHLDVIYANKLALINLSRSETKKLTVHSFFEKEVVQSVVEAIENFIDSGKSPNLEFKDKSKWYALDISSINESIGFESALLIINDITQKKISEQTLRSMNEELETKVLKRTKDLEKAKNKIEIAYQKEKELSKLKSQFVSTASHQFRTPLTVILSNIGLLEMQIQEVGPEFKVKFDRVYQRIQSEVKRMTDLMDDVLILGKKESGNLKPNLKSVDTLVLIQSIIQKHNQIQIDDREIYVTSKGHKEMYELDPKLFENAFSNLISNAFKYSLTKKTPLVHVEYKKDMLTITIQDFGIGIPKSDISNIFEPFYRANNVGDINGTGLGTSIVKAYLELMGGRVSVESIIGEGSTFTITIQK